MKTWRPAAAATVVSGCVLALAMPSNPAVAGPGYTSYAARSLCAPPADTVAPAVSQVSFGRSTLDLNSGSRRQTITATASDASGTGDPSGVHQLTVLVRGNRSFNFVHLTLTSGTAAAGDWAGQFTVSRYAHAGTYSIESIDAVDADGNRQSYEGYGSTASGPNALSLHPADDPTFTVTGTPATPPPRKAAGTLTSFGFGPSHVDTTKEARRVHVTARFAGAAPRRVFTEFGTVKSTRVKRYIFLRGALHRGTHGWTGSVLVPRWLGDQTVVPTLYASWGRGFKPEARGYSSDRLKQLGFPSKLAIVSGIDKSRPTLKAVSFSPDPIDSTNGPEQVTVTARAGDVGSGVRYVEVNANIRHGVNGLAGGTYPLEAAGVGFLSSSYFHVRLKKTPSGSWVGTMKVRQCVPSGDYKVAADLRDVAGNYHYYSTRSLSRANLTSTVHVTSKRGDVVAPYVYSAATLALDNEIILNFSEGVANVNTSTLAVYALSPRSSRFTSPEDVTGITCADGKDAVDCSGANGTITSAVLTVPSLTPGVIYEIFANQDQVTPQLVDGNGNPMDWNYQAYQVKDS